MSPPDTPAKATLRRMFRDPAHEARFRTDGFVALPLLTETEVRDFLELFERVRPTGEIHGMHTTFHDNAEADNLEVDGLVRAVFRERVARMFVDCDLAGGSFFVKGTDRDSQSIPHQDWNIVDERRFTSLNIWCPLIDVDARNGTLMVVRGTHNRFDTIRSITVPSTNFDLDEIAPFADELPMRAGEAVVYAHDLFHGSRPNRSGRPRPVVIAAVLPREAQQLHYYRPPGETAPTVEALHIDQSFWYGDLLSYYSGARPPFPSLGTRTFDPQGPSLAELRSCAERAHATE